MVGEIRDKQTARMAIEAALTGHLVFSTVHTNDAPSVVMRLMDMGIEPFLINAAITGVLRNGLRVKYAMHAKLNVNQLNKKSRCLQKYGASLKNALSGTGMPECLGLGYKGVSVSLNYWVCRIQLRSVNCAISII